MNGKGELQLLPGTKKRLGIKIPGENRFLYAGSAILGAAIVISFWFNFSIKSLESQMNTTDEQLFILEQKRDEKAEENIQTIRRQISLTSKLIDEHVYSTKAFSKLGSLMQENIQVKSVSYELTTGKFDLVGLAGSYTTIARQIASFLSDDSIMDVSVGKMKPNPDGTIEFGFTLSYNQVKLFKKVKTE